jgi:DNA-binding CsgD family transcriptional regulator
MNHPMPSGASSAAESRHVAASCIAQELQIAPETVKSHVKSIFIKLAVQTRAHAVSTASALGLL